MNSKTATIRTLFQHEGQDICLIQLSNARGMQVELSNYGALIKSLIVPDKNGNPVDVVLGFDELEDYFSAGYRSAYPYMGTIVGRCANRIGQAQFTIDGNTYQVSANTPPHQLHGGMEGFDRKVWRVKSLSDCPESQLVLTYLSKDGEEGFPGNLTVEASFTLTDENELKLEFSAHTDAPTPVDLTHHGYFNLDGDASPIFDHELKIDADSWLGQYPDCLTNGEIIPVENTNKDFRNSRKLKITDDFAGYDQAFVLNQPVINHCSAELYSPKTGIRMELFTNQPAIQFYTAQHLGPFKGKNGLLYQAFSGLCLETQVHPNAINTSHFPDVILRPGGHYLHQCTYKFSTL